MITRKMFEDAVKAFEHCDTINGTVYYPVKHLKDGRNLCLVFGWVDGYQDGGEDYQRDGYTLCCKLAINIDDLQCDYDVDWYMPWDSKGEVYDTNMALTRGFDDVDWYNKQANIIAKMLDTNKLECK